MKTFSTLLFSLIFLLNGFCQTNDSSEALINIMKTEFEAFKKKDPSVWMSYVADDAVFTNANSIFKTKDQIVEEMKAASAIFNTATETYEGVMTKIFGNTAVLSCLTTFSFISADGNRNNLKFKFTRVHIKEGNSWKLIYHSAIPVEF
jgi:ketosteroid isomerase-like protein